MKHRPIFLVLVLALAPIKGFGLTPTSAPVQSPAGDQVNPALRIPKPNPLLDTPPLRVPLEPSGAATLYPETLPTAVPTTSPWRLQDFTRRVLNLEAMTFDPKGPIPIWVGVEGWMKNRSQCPPLLKPYRIRFHCAEGKGKFAVFGGSWICKNKYQYSSLTVNLDHAESVVVLFFPSHDEPESYRILVDDPDGHRPDPPLVYQFKTAPLETQDFQIARQAGLNQGRILAYMKCHSIDRTYRSQTFSPGTTAETHTYRVQKSAGGKFTFRIDHGKKTDLKEPWMPEFGFPITASNWATSADNLYAFDWKCEDTKILNIVTINRRKGLTTGSVYWQSRGIFSKRLNWILHRDLWQFGSSEDWFFDFDNRKTTHYSCEYNPINP